MLKHLNIGLMTVTQQALSRLTATCVFLVTWFNSLPPLYFFCFFPAADDSGQCILYDVGARKCITSFTPHEMDCRSIRFSPDSQHILTGSYDACVAITAVQYRNSEILSESQVVGKHADKIIQCRWHPSEYSFVSTSADKTVALWQETTR